ncbi:hypothetical protein HMPREF1548_01143 [Clostridium sp. KLE 1755]|nr:hypothetical protein HMPREF1548_01143 [Clostridium sp. KLE 1755]
MYKPFFTASSQKTAAVLFTAVPEPLATRWLSLYPKEKPGRR